MKLLVLDIESYFDRRDYSLSKMTTESYVRDSRFEAHGCAIKTAADKPAFWVPQEHLKAAFASINWKETFCVAHHANFDGLILSHHYKALPKIWGCTLSMARLLLGNHLSVSLEAVRKHFGLPSKTTPYNLFEGKRWNELSPATKQMVGAGAVDEVESIWRIFHLLLKDFPKEELGVVDSVIRMFTEPALRADTQMLSDLWKSEEARKADGLAELGLDESDLQSADKFADLLREEGVEPEEKEGKNGPIYAFAKTDQFMRDLLEHDSERVRLLAETRLGVKSTILQTRAETLGWMASRGPLPVYLRYAGAGTLRVSGGDGANFLNMKRGSPIRKALIAPEGYVLAPIDASQIEFRCGHYLAGGLDAIALQRIRSGQDPYVITASKFYKREIYKPAKDDPRRAEMEAARGLGKQGELMLIYGAAAKQFKATAKNGLYGPPADISIEDADAFVRLWREDNAHITHRVTGYWQTCEEMLKVLAGGATWQVGPLLCTMHKIYLPNGAMMNYDSLEWHRPDDTEECRDFERQGYWRMKTRQGWKKMWGSKLTQNICEAVSRVIVSQAMLRIKHQYGFRTLNWPYDELLLLLPRDGHEDKNLELCMAEMRREPTWLPGLPLDCEGQVSERYSK
jgi:DNA polymerase bacteriophage-type